MKWIADLHKALTSCSSNYIVLFRFFTK